MLYKLKIEGIDGLSGYVVLETFDINQKIELMRSIDESEKKYQLHKEGQKPSDFSSYEERLKFFIFILNLAKEINLKVNGIKINDVESLSSFVAFSDVAREIVSFYSNGIKYKYSILKLLFHKYMNILSFASGCFFLIMFFGILYKIFRYFFN